MSFDIDKYNDLCNRADGTHDRYMRLLKAVIALYDIPEEVKDADRKNYDKTLRTLNEFLDVLKGDINALETLKIEMLIRG